MRIGEAPNQGFKEQYGYCRTCHRGQRAGQHGYNQWTQFEAFSRFMESVEEVTQLDDTHLQWRARIGGKEAEWDAEITEQVPDMRIAWRSTSGAANAGVVTFHRLSDSSTRIMPQLGI
jgi:uncharacterized membrane protein